jgi:hypothetical protein
MPAPDCKVVATYFGPRRRVPSGVDETIALLKLVVARDKKVDAGRPMDTVLVNHDVSEIVPAAQVGREWLDAIDGQKTRNGHIRVLHRPWQHGIGGSFASFNFAFAAFRDEYEYWFFTEDDVMPVADGYFEQAVHQLTASPRTAS